MINQEKAGKYFVIGAGVAVLFIVGAIAWALTLAPNEEAGLKFNDDGNPWFGKENAKVVIREFSDFECPACRIADEGVAFVRQTYGDKVRFVWNDFPLAMHKNSIPAAAAARCAGEQGKYWEFHDKLFAEQEKWTQADVPSSVFDGFAKDLALDVEAFSTCLITKRQEQKINIDAQEGLQNNIKATPTFFINNRRFEGAISNDTWKTEIEAALKR